MGKITHPAIRAVAVAALCHATWLSIARSAEHPGLVSVEATRCTTCHDTVLAGRGSIHAPARDDCTSCHDLTVAETETTIEPVATEPELCLMCHDSLRAAADGALASPHAATVDSCIACHQPHASDHEKLLNASGNELCFTCHDADATDAAHELPVRRATCVCT